MTPRHTTTRLAARWSCALAALLLAGLAPACAGTGKCPARERKGGETSVNDLSRFYGKHADQDIRLADGHRLLVWNYSVEFSELEPARFAFIAVACGGEVLGVEKLWEGARLDASGGGDMLVSRQEYEALADASVPTEQKLAVLRRLEFAAPLLTSEARSQR